MCRPLDGVETVAALTRQGYGMALLSGDRAPVVEDIARRSGIKTWCAGLKPADKIAWLEVRASEGYKVLMVGDGLNDAPALAAAHASISPATAADISQRAADFVFQGAKLAPVLDPWPCRISPSPPVTTRCACRWPWPVSSRR